MALAGCLHLSHDLGICKSHCYTYNKQFKIVVAGRGQRHFLSSSLSVCNSFQSWDSLGFHLADRQIHSISRKYNGVRCHFSLVPGKTLGLDNLKIPTEHFLRSLHSVQSGIPVHELVPAVGLIIFTVWGLGPLMQQSRNLLFHKNDSSWKNSKTNCVLTSYFQPLLLWTGTLLICRALDPVVLTTEASQVVKQRLIHFVGSLSTVLVFAYCLSSMIQQAQNFFMVSNESDNTRKMGLDFAGKAVYSAVWVGAIALFMELLGFSTQKWVTAGGLGTVLLTLAGREIFTNFLSSVMIHATRPFIVNEWIQTKIQGYDVSGTVEYVGWWSPTIVRGEDREALHIPNHKFTVNIVRNLTQKTHWRIKTHLAISHLDVNKINVIIADMRKVLAKNPQIEQQRLHRRVFLENVNAESQALSILISCFVKTSRFEEYLCAKEGIVMDLLRVISHHQARLATPIRTMQKIYSDADLENIPFADSIFNNGGGSGSGGGDGSDGGGVESKRPLLLIEPSYRISSEEKAKAQSRSDKKTDAKVVEKSASDIPKSGQDPSSGGKTENTPSSKTETGAEEASGSQEGKRSPALEENIVLGAALEGSKGTLPIDEDRKKNGSSTPKKDKKDDQILNAPPDATIANGQ